MSNFCPTCGSKLSDSNCSCFTISEEEVDETPYFTGRAYLIRTITHYYTGQLKNVYENEFLFEEAAWIVDTGRYSECLRDGKFNEIESFTQELILNRASIVDMVQWKHRLPRETK